MHARGGRGRRWRVAGCCGLRERHAVPARLAGGGAAGERTRGAAAARASHRTARGRCGGARSVALRGGGGRAHARRLGGFDVRGRGRAAGARWAGRTRADRVAHPRARPDLAACLWREPVTRGPSRRARPAARLHAGAQPACGRRTAAGAVPRIPRRAGTVRGAHGLRGRACGRSLRGPKISSEELELLCFSVDSSCFPVHVERPLGACVRADPLVV